MKLKIYQINMERDTENAKFRQLEKYDAAGNLIADASIYDEVFSGTVECEDLEAVFQMFNTGNHPYHRGHSLSVSDVLVTEEGTYICQPVGFDAVIFDETQTQKPDNLIRVLYVEPGKKPYETEITNDLKGLQSAVQGLFEVVYLDEDAILVCNDMGKLIGMPGNRRLSGGTVIAGPFFIAGDGGEDFCSLNDKQMEYYMHRFQEPEVISRTEVEADMGFYIY